MPIASDQLAGLDSRAGRASDDERLSEKRELPGDDESKAQFLSVRVLRQQYLDYLNSKVDEINEQQDARRYYHGAHYTAEQLKVLRNRHQPPQTWNRVARKINGIVGLVERFRSDPKALARSPKSEGGAEIAHQSIRYVLDSNQFKSLSPWCLLQAGIDGFAGAQMVLVRGDKGDPDISLAWVIGDEYFYDPMSYRFDFSDKRYDGIAKWIDVEEAIELFPDKEDLLRGLIEGDSDLTTNPDREYKWVNTATKRIRLVEHWYKHRGKWCWAFYCAMVLLEEGVSPFYDEKGNSTYSIHSFAAAVDHDGDRYGFVRNLKGPQDALNQGKSKTLHLANTRLIKMTKGAVEDVEIARREAARPDGVIEVQPGQGNLFEIVDTKQDVAVFSTFTEDAKSELDQFANINVAALTGASLGTISGRAIELLRQPGMAELGPFILAYRAWKLQIFRAIWNAVQRHWTGERWIRVNNDENMAQFIQINGMDLDQWGRPAIVNAVGALDVDIILDEGPDVASLMQDTYDALKGYPPGTFPPQVLIELSSLPRSDKNRILNMLSPKPAPPNPAAEAAARLQLEGLAAKNAKTAAEVRKTHAGADELLAKAEKERAGVGTEAARAGHLAMAAHIDAAAFARDTLAEAHRIAAPQPDQPAPAAQPAVRPAPPLQYPMPF